MPDEPLPPPPTTPEAPSPVPAAPPPEAGPLPPPAPSGRIRHFFQFSGGCFITLLVGFATGLVMLGSSMNQAMGCAAVQLLYVVPLAILLFRKGRTAWATGFIFGCAVVFLMASICGDMKNMH